MTGRLLAIDGLNIVRRVYEASPEPDSDLKAEIAMRHAFNAFQRLVNGHEPTHILPAFDYGGPTWRHTLYKGYRAGRQPMPDVLREALPQFYMQLTNIGMCPIAIPDVEADDVIGTVVTRWLSENRGEAVVASTDKDLHCLIAEGARIWDHFKSEWHDRAWVEQKWGVTPGMLPDLLALMGDETDSIPGVSNVGVKTAAKLLRTYGTLDAIMAGAGILKDKVGESLRKERDMLYLSRQLVQLKTDVRIGVSWNMLAWDHR
jgi:protein Xni